MRELPAAIQAQITEARTDIGNIAWDEMYYEDGQKEWVVPCETVFTAAEMGDDCPSQLGPHYGNLRIEYDPAYELLDYFVGDWTPGMHPDLNTDRR